MGRGNIENLKVPSSEEARKNGAKGGKKSGEARREKKKLQEALQKRLSGKYKIGEENNEVELGGYDAMAEAMIIQAVHGNVKAFVAIRDTIGEKPTDKIEFPEENTVTGIKIKFVNKSKANTKPEKDPKIVGEYTPPSNTEEE